MSSGQNGSVAPACPISLGEVLPAQAGIMMPTIPKAMDLPSLIAAVNAITQMLQLLSGQILPIGAPFGSIGIGLTGQRGAPGKAGKKGKPGKDAKHSGKWRETNRVKETVKVVNPDDDAQFVTFERINSLTFTNGTTGEQLTWHR